MVCKQRGVIKKMECFRTMLLCEPPGSDGQSIGSKNMQTFWRVHTDNDSVFHPLLAASVCAAMGVREADACMTRAGEE